YYRMSILLRLLDHVPQPLLALTIILAHDLRPTNAHKVRIGLARNRPSEQCLSRAWRSVKQDTLRCFNPKSLKQFRMSQRELYHLPDLLNHGSQTSDVLVADLWYSPARFLDLLANKMLGSFGDDHSSCRS